MKKKPSPGPIQKWGEKIGWKKRVKAVCKPCWEIKYCPYGPVIEEFPIKDAPDEQSCRIFGHDCPVFYVAEPLTETKELRNISRSISRPTQFKVLKRENQICSDCGKSVKDEEVEFDHIIPLIKGGSSDEYNITLLCRKCNRKKGSKFEDKHLVETLGDHVGDPVEIDVLLPLLFFMDGTHELYEKENRSPVALDICKLFGRRKVGSDDEAAVEVIENINSFFQSERPKEIKQKVFNALKYRWGFTDGKTHKIKDTIKKFNIEADELIHAEKSFISRLGWHIMLTDSAKRKWLNL